MGEQRHFLLRKGAPDLGLHSILARAHELLDADVLLDPFEKEIDTPALLVEGGDRQGWQRGVVHFQRTF